MLSASAHMRHLGERKYRVEIDLKPALDEPTLDKRLLSDFEKHINSDFINALGDLLPKKMIPTVVARSGIGERSKVHSVTREQRHGLVRLLKHFSVEIAGARPVEEAIITSGGVSVGEVNPSTMASKLVPGLFFAGEVLDVDAYTGGVQSADRLVHRPPGRRACGLAVQFTVRRESMKEHYAVAIDGPSGAGKSTLARALAKELGFVYVDTGAIYRSVGYYAYQRGIDPADGAAVEALLPEIQLEMLYREDGLQHMILNGEDVTKEIRLPEISMYASRVSAIPAVRAFLMDMQRDMARTHSVIMDGRDIGTVVLPQADVKLFLTASAEDRARRRCLELEERGTPEPYEKLLEEMQERDRNDASRSAAPLRPAEDAVILDTTGNTFQQSFDLLLQTIKERL